MCDNFSKNVGSGELRGGILYSVCMCSKRNGLQDECRKSMCMGQDQCLTKPQPQCPPALYARQLYGGLIGEKWDKSQKIDRRVPRKLPRQMDSSKSCVDCNQQRRRKEAERLVKDYKPFSEYKFEPRTFSKDDRCFQMEEIDCGELERYEKTGILPKKPKDGKKHKDPIGR